MLFVKVELLFFEVDLAHDIIGIISFSIEP